MGAPEGGKQACIGCACLKHSCTFVRDCVPDSCACVRNCVVDSACLNACLCV
jgi:hypothetical protein